MSTKPSSGPFPLRAASLVLTGSAQTVVGTVAADQANATTGAVALGQANQVVVRFNYARAVPSASGAPIVSFFGSMDATTTAAASVSNWQPLLILGTTFSAGQIDVYPEAQALLPSAVGTRVCGTHPVDTSVFNWLRVQIADVDGANPGTVSDIVLGGTL